jgi:hypothetical protein
MRTFDSPWRTGKGFFFWGGLARRGKTTGIDTKRTTDRERKPAHEEKEAEEKRDVLFVQTKQRKSGPM